MLDFMIWFWLALFVLTLILEIFTADLVSVWFSLAAIPSFIMALLDLHIAWQITSFIVISAVLLLLTRPLVKKYLKTNEIKTNVDAMVGMIVTVIKEIRPNEVGRVVVRSLDWSAISKETILVGDKARVLDIEGNKLIVEKIENN